MSDQKQSWGLRLERDLEARGVLLGPVEIDPETGGQFRRVLGFAPLGFAPRPPKREPSDAPS